MALRTPEQYIESLRDGRAVYYRGERVGDVTTHPELGVGARHAALLRLPGEVRTGAIAREPRCG